MSYISSQQVGDQPSSLQIRAARALLGITSQDLAAMSGVGWATIRRFEDAEGVPPSRSGTLDRVKSALEDAGIEFLGDPISSPGVRLKRK
ncbi:transcriptional regulator [Qipengyuania flava]|nr:transcriptional regulator [Qipengyuania flava]